MNIEPKEKTIKVSKLIAGVMVLMIVIYLIMIQIWNLTSPTYKPCNALDFCVRTPAHVEDWLVRRKDGI